MANHCISMDLEDHQLAHILTTSTCVEAGSAPVISANFARCRGVTQRLNGWNSVLVIQQLAV
jgi:hypothetical protein